MSIPAMWPAEGNTLGAIVLLTWVMLPLRYILYSDSYSVTYNMRQQLEILFSKQPGTLGVGLGADGTGMVMMLAPLLADDGYWFPVAGLVHSVLASFIDPGGKRSP